MHQKIQEFNTNVEFNFYLLHIVKRNFQNVQIDPETLEKTDEHTRQLAFILLKNNVKRIYPSMPQQLKHRIKETTLSILGYETHRKIPNPYTTNQFNRSRLKFPKTLTILKTCQKSTPHFTSTQFQFSIHVLLLFSQTKQTFKIMTHSNKNYPAIQVVVKRKEKI